MKKKMKKEDATCGRSIVRYFYWKLRINDTSLFVTVANVILHDEKAYRASAKTGSSQVRSKHQLTITQTTS